MRQETSDATVLDLLREQGSLGVAELADKTSVTATAVRQRLHRLMADGLVERRLDRSGRGRPSHRYGLTDKGARASGSNYADLAVALWQEVRAIRDPDVRRGLLQRIVRTLASSYAGQVDGRAVAEKMESLGRLMGERNVPFKVSHREPDGDEEGSTGLPVLTALACPYPELAEADRSVCAMERMLFAEVIGTDLKLTQCRLDGANCCTFEPT